MDLLFVKALNMSISASWLVLAVLVLRLLLKKAPRWIHVALWALVAVRLICPVSLESVFSLIPSTQTVPEEIFYLEPPLDSQNTTLEILQPRPNGEAVDVELDTTVSVAQTRSVSWAFIWPAGMAVMVLYALISYLRLKRKVSASIDVGNGVYICDYIDTPFILGIVKPKIYLPSAMEPDSASHVLAHERAHMARKDHWWKPLGYALLSAYWFNPVLWLAYILLCRDIELACDEKVIRDMAVPEKKAYSEALLSCSVSRRSIAACPLAFGEVGVKERVKTVLNYKKPAFWIVLVALAALIVTAVCFLTDPVARTDKVAVQWFEEYAYEEVKGRMDRDEVVCLDAREGYALVYCQGQGPTLTLYRYEKKGDGFRILDSCAGEYAISGGMSLNHLEDNGKHIYFGTASQYHWNPKAEVNTTLYWNYMILTDANGKKYEKDMTGKDGFLFILDTQMADFQVFDVLETECLNVKKFTEQGYYMVEAVFESGKASPGSIPYAWTSTLNTWDIQKCWTYQEAGSLHNTIERIQLNKLVHILNDVAPEEIVSRAILGQDDPLWNLGGASVQILCTDGTNVMLRYVADTVIITPDTEFDLWETDGYWIIENDALKQWMRSISLGGTDMLSDENREEIRQLLRMEQVQFFDPQTYENLLFVGCWYDGGRGLGVAVYEPLADGYRLLKLIRGDEVKTCASGSELYYCDYQDLRIFLILNQDITGMEWSGAYEKDYAIDTHPGLVVEYFPENLDAMYRFRYGGGATTMYMDRSNQTHGQAPEYVSDAFTDPDDAHSVLANLRLSDINYVWVCDRKELDDKYYQPIAKSLSSRETVELMNILREIPQSAYASAEFAGYSSHGLEIELSPKEDSYFFISMTLSDGVFYCESRDGENAPHQIWKIEDDALLQFVENHLSDDTSQWAQFAPFPKHDGEISFVHGSQQITVPRLLCFRYEYTEEGIRFKPEDQSSWLELQYREEPYAPDQKGLRDIKGKYGEQDVIYGYYDAYDSWRYMDINMADGNEDFHLLLLNDAGDAWVDDYGREISWLIDAMEILQIG